MIIVLKQKATEKEIIAVGDKIKKMGLKTHISKGVERTIIGAIGDESLLKHDQIKAMSCVERVMPILKPYKLVSREFKKEDTVVVSLSVKTPLATHSSLLEIMVAFINASYSLLKGKSDIQIALPLDVISASPPGKLTTF